MKRKSLKAAKPHSTRNTLRRRYRTQYRQPVPGSPPSTTTLPGVALGSWQLTGAAITGLAHWHKGSLCQDAVRWSQQPRPVLALSDGAGSAAVSEIGAQTLSQGMVRFVASLEDEVSHWLDHDHTDAQLEASSHTWRLRLLRHAQGLLQDLASSHRRSLKDVRATLLMAVLGQKHCFWWQVGDGSIVAQTPAKPAPKLRTLGNPHHAKGEFANETIFVDNANLDDVQCGYLPSHSVTGWALMSDGGAAKLVSHDGTRVAPRLNHWMASTAEQSFSPDKLVLAYHDRAMWERTCLDDCGIVLAGRLPASAAA